MSEHDAGRDLYQFAYRGARMRLWSMETAELIQDGLGVRLRELRRGPSVITLANGGG